MVNDIATVPEKPERLFFIDNLRSALIILVILHHLSVIYGANTPFYYLEPARQDIPALIVLVVFQLINQAYFMGLFFLISGYFTSGSFDHKGAPLFLKDRLLRLGIPTLIFMFILSPIASIGIYQMPASLTGITTPLTWQQYPNLIGIGPMWFAVMLLVFDFGYVAWRMATKDRAAHSATNPIIPNYRTIAVFILALALASYLLRIVMPLGKYLFSFPSLAYLPQYISFFIIGTIAFHHKWFLTIPDSMGKWGFRGALVATLTLFPIALSSSSTSGSPGAFLGNGYWQSGVYTLWDSTFSVGMGLGLITIFRRSFDRQGRLGRFLYQNAFAVYVFHIPVIVLLALALRGIHIEQLLKFGLAAIIGVPLCFAVAYLVRKIPLMAKIL
ncbi:MAG: acyltransferase family protein [Methanotrichaceae archaeon]